MKDSDYTKNYTAEEMNKEAWITAYVGAELLDELKQISIQSRMRLEFLVIDALKVFIRHYNNGDYNVGNTSHE